MKIEKSNSPVAVGALALVLALIVGRIVWMMIGHSGSVAAASSASTSSPAPNAASTPVIKAAPPAAAAPVLEAAHASLAAAPATTRNPFAVGFAPAPAAGRPGGLPHNEAWYGAARGAGAVPPAPVPLTPLPPFPVRVLESGPGTGAMRAARTPRRAAPARSQGAAKELAEALPPLKLTATVGGTEPMAIVQTASAEPVILHLGDSFMGMRVVAIHEREVVFARGNDFWALPLQSADTVAAGSTSVTPLTPATSQPAISAAAPQEETNATE